MCIWCVIDQMDEKAQKHVIHEMMEDKYVGIIERIRLLITSLVQKIRG